MNIQFNLPYLLKNNLKEHKQFPQPLSPHWQIIGENKHLQRKKIYIFIYKYIYKCHQIIKFQ